MSDDAKPTREVSELAKNALSLSPEARAALVGLTLQSLDNRIDASSEEEWNREIARRIPELGSGSTKAVPRGEATRRVPSRLRSWSEYLAESPAASPEFMENVEGTPAPQR